jgi:hypothetical protein
MTTTAEPMKIRPFIGVKPLKDGDLTPLLDASVKGLLANAAIYQRLPVDLPVYQQGVTAFEASIPAALDGGKAAVAQKKKLRAAAIKMYVQTAHYVAANCNDDMATFLLSGFQAVSTTKTTTPPASESFRKVEVGPNSGQISATLMKYRGASSYGLRWAQVPPGGAPSAWTSQAVVSIKTPTTITGLVPGTVYAFQARALTKAGFTDWSDSVTLMCT